MQYYNPVSRHPTRQQREQQYQQLPPQQQLVNQTNDDARHVPDAVLTIPLGPSLLRWIALGLMWFAGLFLFVVVGVYEVKDDSVPKALLWVAVVVVLVGVVLQSVAEMQTRCLCARARACVQSVS